MKAVAHTFVAVALVVAVIAATADAGPRGRGKGHKSPPTTLPVITLDCNEYCNTVCQPSEPTLVPGTECIYKWKTCACPDEYGFPNCWSNWRGCTE